MVHWYRKHILFLSTTSRVASVHTQHTSLRRGRWLLWRQQHPTKGCFTFWEREVVAWMDDTFIYVINKNDDITTNDVTICYRWMRWNTNNSYIILRWVCSLVKINCQKKLKNNKQWELSKCWKKCSKNSFFLYLKMVLIFFISDEINWFLESRIHVNATVWVYKFSRWASFASL